MKIINLIEDTQGTEGLHAEHGLSIYIETSRHKILVDTGASEKTWENAERLGGKAGGNRYSVFKPRALRPFGRDSVFFKDKSQCQDLSASVSRFCVL